MPSLSDLEHQMQRTLSKAKLKLSPLPYCSEIELALFDPSVLQGPIPHDEAQAIVAEPSYWSFCWASGQVLAAYILSKPELVKGKRVVDIGSGSGVVAIACALAGAEKVWACDIDPEALNACAVNADINKVDVELIGALSELLEPCDLMTAADVLYDRDNHPLLDSWLKHADNILLADSRMKQLPSTKFRFLETFEARTWPDLNEFEEFNHVRIYYA